VSSGVGLGAVTLDGGKLVTTSTGSLANDLTFADSKTTFLPPRPVRLLYALRQHASTGNFNTGYQHRAGATAHVRQRQRNRHDRGRQVGADQLRSVESHGIDRRRPEARCRIFQDQLSFPHGRRRLDDGESPARRSISQRSVIQFVNNLRVPAMC
jgi:hypothetical protein